MKINTRNNSLLYLFIILSISTGIQGHHGVETLNDVIFIVLIFGSLVNLFFFQNKMYYNSKLLIFCIVLTLSVLVIGFIGAQYYDIVNAIKGLAFFLGFVLITFTMANNPQNLSTYWQIINTISTIAIILVIFQTILHYLFGFDLHEIKLIGNTIFNAVDTGEKFRPSSIFSEPSHLAEFVLLSLYHYIFISHKYIVATILFAGLIISTSGLGIVGGLFLIMVWVFLYNSKNLSFDKKVLIFVLRVMLLIIFGMSLSYFYALLSNTDNWLLKRLASGATVEARVLRSFDIYSQLNFGEKIIGIGIQNQANYMDYYSITSQYDNLDTLLRKEYAQTLGYILTTTGVIGLVTFMFSWIELFLKFRSLRIIISLFIFICFVSNVMTRNIMIVFMVIILTTSRVNHDESDEIKT